MGCFDFVILVILWVLCFDFSGCDLICDLGLCSNFCDSLICDFVVLWFVILVDVVFVIWTF